MSNERPSVTKYDLSEKIAGLPEARAASQVNDRGQVEDTEGSESVGFSHGDFGFVVEALDNAAGKQLLGAEVVEDELTVLAQRRGDDAPTGRYFSISIGIAKSTSFGARHSRSLQAW
jgi:hypothetical protein